MFEDILGKLKAFLVCSVIVIGTCGFVGGMASKLARAGSSIEKVSTSSGMINATHGGRIAMNYDHQED